MNLIRKTGVKKVTALYPFPIIQQSNNQTDKKQRVAAYCRVSKNSDEQLVSYHTQVMHYDQYIRTRPDYELAGIFADEGISGTDQRKRDAFNQMMKTAREGHIDLIITKSLSRFGRNTLDCLKNIRELRSLGVDVYFEKENIHTLHSEGEMLLTLVSAIAQNESLNQSENVKWGIHRQYERGHVQSIPSGKFLGYRKDSNGYLVIDDAQATTVRRIYQLFLCGFGTYQIATMLTAENVPMAYGGKEWCASHIQKVLVNEKYQGDTRFQKTYNADYLTKRRAINKGQFPQHYLKDTHAAIIDRETWSLVQLELARQKEFVQNHFTNKYHHHSKEFPLSGKIVCQVCGHLFVLRESSRKVDSGQKYWICKEYKAGRYGPVGPNACKNGHRIKPSKVENAVLNAWNYLVDHQWNHSNNENDRLTAYRIRDLHSLLEDHGHLDDLPYSVLIRILDRLEVGLNGDLTVVFLAGASVHFG